MTQLSPSSTYLGQAIAALQQYQRDLGQGKFKNTEEVLEGLNNVITQYVDNAGKPLVMWEPVYKGEPPTSDKMNRFLSMLEKDIAILQDQVTLLRSYTLFLHNSIKTDILRAQHQNGRAFNKVKTLQLYTTVPDKDMLIFGDYFKNDELIDPTRIADGERVLLDSSGYITLPKNSSASSPLRKAQVTLLPTSNGFIGNNQEIKPESLNSTTVYFDPTGQPQKNYIFVSDTSPANNLSHMLDGDPTTWVEYEYYRVSDEDRNTAKNLNFVYRKDSGSIGDYILDGDLVDWATGPGAKVVATGASSPMQQGSIPTVEAPSSSANEVEQAKLPTNTGKAWGTEQVYPSVLKFDFEIDLKEVQKINNFSLTPYGMLENKNHPIYISRVEISPDGTNWDTLRPFGVWIINSADVSNIREVQGSSVFIGKATWFFAERYTRFIRVYAEQRYPMPSLVGHTYWVQTTATETQIPSSDRYSEAYGDSSGLTLLPTVGSSSGRILGPIPPASKPSKFNSPTSVYRANMVRRIEVFNGQRWGVGVRDVSVEHVDYKTVGTLVSTPFRVNGIVDRVSIEADVSIPNDWDPTVPWVRFYISPDDGVSWYQISRIQDDYLGIPEVIAFNDPLPSEFHEPGVAYYNVNTSVDALRVKVELTRPSGENYIEEDLATPTMVSVSSATPVVRNYKLKVRKR